MQETDLVHAPNNREANRDRHGRSFAVAVALIGCALALTACGSSSPRSSRSPNGSGSNPNQAQILNESLRFTRCVRADGVPNFPDAPSNGGYGVKSFAQQSHDDTISINGVSVNAPAFRSAMAKCQHYLPQPPAPTTSQLATIRTLMVTWAKCMRSHGLPDFGDPTITADGHRIMHGQFDIDSPAYESARQACDPQLQRSMAAAGV
jgi:hypothetical protein